MTAKLLSCYLPCSLYHQDPAPCFQISAQQKALNLSDLCMRITTISDVYLAHFVRHGSKLCTAYP